MTGWNTGTTSLWSSWRMTSRSTSPLFARPACSRMKFLKRNLLRWVSSLQSFQPRISIVTIEFQSGWGKTSTYSEVSDEVMKFEILMKPLSYCEHKLDLENLPSESQLCGLLASKVSWPPELKQITNYNLNFQECGGQGWASMVFIIASNCNFGYFSGSPIQSSLPEESCVYRVAGLSSYGSPLCGSKYPLVYTKVSNYLDWIERHVWNSNNWLFDQPAICTRRASVLQ